MTARKKTAAPISPAQPKRTPRTPKKASAPPPADWAPAFLAALSQTANIRDSAKAAGIGRTTVYDRRDIDEVFAKAMADAIEDAVDDLALEARRRATRTRRPSDVLLIFLLKAHRPDVYRERYDVKHGGRIETGAAETMTDDELARIIQAGAAVPKPSAANPS
jgi:hypothetical protein